MGSDLPYVRQDVPDDSEAPKVGGRLQAGKESRTPCHTACVQGHNCISVSGLRRAYPHAASGCGRAVASALALTSRLGPQASADELTTQRAQRQATDRQKQE